MVDIGLDIEEYFIAPEPTTGVFFLYALGKSRFGGIIVRNSKIGSILVLGLVASLLQASPAAYSNVENVVKTFLVTKDNNEPYANVSVALFGFNEDTNVSFLSDIAVTNGSGTATITVPANLDYYGWSAQPPANDFSHALFTDYSVSKGATETLSAKLNPASVNVKLVNADLSAATIGSTVSFPATGDGATSLSYKTVIVDRAFGLDISSALVASGSYGITVEPNASPTQFAAKYGLKAVGNPVTSYKLFSDTNYTTELVATTSVYTLAFAGPNFSGQLKNSSGAALTIPSGVRVFAQIFPANADGSVNLESGASSAALVTSNGSFSSRIYTPTAGKYFVQFYSSGSLSIPTFLSSPFWVNNSGSYSTSQSGPFQASNVFSFSASLPASPNTKIRVTSQSGSAISNIYISLNQRSQNGVDETWWGYASASNGQSSFSMPDGNYKIFLDPSDPTQLRAEYRLTIDGGVAFVSSQSGAIIAADSSGVFQLALDNPNVQLRLVNPVNPNSLLNDTNVDVFRNNVPGNNYVTSGYARSGSTGLKVPDGDYTLRVNPFGGTLAPKDYQLTVSGDSVRIEDGNTRFASVNGVFTLTVNSPNVTGVVEEPIDAGYFPFAARGQKNASVQIEKYDPSPDRPGQDWVHYSDSQVGTGGVFAAYIQEAGTYRIVVRVNGAPGAVSTTFGEFDMNPSVAITFDGDNSLQLRAPTLQVSVREAGSLVNLEGAWFELSNDDMQLYEGYDTGSSGVAGIAIDIDGIYQIHVRPPYDMSSSVAAAQIYTLEASNNLGTIVVKNSSDVVVEPVNGVYALQLGVPNVIGKITGSAGEAFVGSEGNYAWIDAQRKDEESNTWQSVNIYADAYEDGTFGLAIAEVGRYRLKIDAYGFENSSTTKTVEFEVTSDGSGYQVDGVSLLDFGTFRLSEPTALFKVRESGSTENLTFTGIEVRQNGEWMDWLNVGNDGLAKFTADEAGTYEFIAMPNDISDSSVQKSFTGVVSGPEGGPYVLSIDGIIPDISGALVLTLGTPNVSGRLVDKNGAAVVNEDDAWTYIQVQKYNASEDRWDWTNNSANVRADGKFALSVEEPGTYRLRVESGGRVDLALTYSDPFTVTQPNLETFTLNFGDIVVNAPVLGGVVLDKDGEPESGAQVVAIDIATGEEMWEYSSSTDSEGNWGMLLPEGSYSLFARPAWRDSTQGNSLEQTGVVVDSNGEATVNGSDTADQIQLQLTLPTWSGKVLNPIDESPIANASVCLFNPDEDQRGSSVCADTNAAGEWALSKPAGFTGFSEESTLNIRVHGSTEFTETRIIGKVAIEGFLGEFFPETPYWENIFLYPETPNTTFTILGGDAPAIDVWVSVFEVVGNNRNWIAGSNTDSDGKVRLRLPTDKDFIVEVQPNANSSYAAVRVSLASEVLFGSGEYTISLGTPNMRGVVSEPGGLPVKNAWVEIYNVDTDEWVGGSGTNALGQFVLGLEGPVSGFTWYRLTAHPSGFGNGNLFSKSIFFAKVSSSDGVELFTSMTSGTLIEPEGGIYTLALRSPTATGFVYLPDGTTPVRNSFVVPVDVSSNNRHLWEIGQNSRNNGSFGLALEDGSYKVFANVPGQLSNYSRSAMCSITIAEGEINTPPSDCVDGAKNVNLKLRNPNLTFTLLDPDTDAPVSNAHVGISVGGWYGWAQSTQSGVVSLLIDQDEIAESNPNWTSGSLPIRFNVQAPDDNSTLASWQCLSGENKPLCIEDLSPVIFGQDYTNTTIDLGEIDFLGANTLVYVTKADGAPVNSGAWVSVFKEEVQGWKRYIGSAGTNSEGTAALYIDSALDTAGARFTIEIHPPWQLRNTEARSTYSGLTLTQINEGTFALAEPNLTLTIKQAPAPYAISRWSNVWIEEVNPVNPSTFAYVTWVNGYGSDESGQMLISLAASKTYRINVNPGPGSIGTRTSCIVSVDGESVVSIVDGQCSTGVLVGSAMELKLSAGNFTGSVALGSANGDQAVGAIVFAQARELGTTTLVVGKTQETVVDSEGNFGLQLDTGYDWEVRVFWVNPSSAPTQYSSITTPQLVARVGNTFTSSPFVLPVKAQ